MSHILIVEDDPVLGRGLKLSLELEGYQVSWAMDLRTASRIETETSIDLFLLDWNLPDGTGLDFCTKLRTGSASVPVMFLTARTDEESAVQALTSGANDFVRKPFGQAELLARIKSALRDSVQRDEQVRFEDILILIKQRRVLFRKEDVDLGRREFDILLHLVRRAGEAVPREDLVALIDKEGRIFDRTIDSHVSHLRAHLARAHVHSVRISSVYGVGYRLEKA